MLAAWEKRGFQIHAMIGSPALLEEAADHVKNRFSFEETKKGETVKNWNEILERLDGQSLTDSAGEAPDEWVVTGLLLCPLYNLQNSEFF